MPKESPAPTARLLKALLSAGLLGVLVYALQSVETMRLSTYYPAPSGVYKRIITTQDTILARKGGKVSIGEAATPDTKLEVAGGSIFLGPIEARRGIDVKGNKVLNVLWPDNDPEGVNKKYVDQKIAENINALRTELKNYVDSRTSSQAPPPPQQPAAPPAPASTTWICEVITSGCMPCNCVDPAPYVSPADRSGPSVVVCSKCIPANHPPISCPGKWSCHQ